MDDRELEHIRRKQREFLDALLVAKWTTPRMALSEQDALEAGRRVGLNEILVSEFLQYWVSTGDLEEYWKPIATKIQKSIGETAFEQIEADFEKSPAGSKTSMAGSARPLVFLCHASEDKIPVRNFASQFSDAGFSTWLDEEQLLPGQEWDTEIRKAIKRSNAVVVFLSRQSQKRGYIQKEILRVLEESENQPEGTIFLIPAKLEPCDVPDRLRRWQWVDLFIPDGFKKVCKALDTHRLPTL